MMAQFDVRRVCRETGIEDIDYREAVSSTNDVALQAVRESPDHTPHRPPYRPRLILADRQQLGRGRGGNRWHSAEGCLTFSLIVDPPAGAAGAELPKLSLITALAARAALVAHAGRHSLSLKWPNDLFLDGSKVGGILIERPSSAVEGIVIGIGVNVNNDLSAAPADIQRVATSLSRATGVTADLNQVLIDILNSLTATLANWIEVAAHLPKLWSPHCLLTGRTVTVRREGLRCTGLCRGIREDGALVLATSSGCEIVRSGIVESYG